MNSRKDLPSGWTRSGWLCLSLALLCLTVAPAGTAAEPGAALPGIGFAGLPGPNLAPFTSYTEGPFTVTPTDGTWLQGTYFGNPAPSIIAGPIGAPTTAILHITDSAGLFSFGSLDFSSNNGISAYDIRGFLGPNQAFVETGFLGAVFPNAFQTLYSTNSSVLVDALVIQLIPGQGVTSINLDNINVLTVPEPGAVLLLALGLAALTARCRSR